MNKNDLRKAALQNRQQYTKDQCASMSRKLSELFFNYSALNLSETKYLHLFLPIAHKNEVDTFLIFNKLKADFPAINIVLSKSDFSKGTMTHFIYTKETILQTNALGIPEPASGKEISAEKLDLVLVPLLVVDEYGNRIGYGKGFYDRFLSECMPDCKKVGLSFENPIPKIDTDPFDIPLDFCITPSNTFFFSH